jgi:hypothetical protein
VSQEVVVVGTEEAMQVLRVALEAEEGLPMYVLEAMDWLTEL